MQLLGEKVTFFSSIDCKSIHFPTLEKKRIKMPRWAFLIFFTLSFTVGNVTAQDDDDNMDSIFLKLVQQQETIHSTPAPILDPILEEANNSLIQAEADVPKPTPSTPRPFLPRPSTPPPAPPPTPTQQQHKSEQEDASGNNNNIDATNNSNSAGEGRDPSSSPQPLSFDLSDVLLHSIYNMRYFFFSTSQL